MAKPEPTAAPGCVFCEHPWHENNPCPSPGCGCGTEGEFDHMLDDDWDWDDDG